MGYSITIGEHLQEEEINEDGIKTIYNYAKEEENPEAPGGDVPTAYTNMRWPSYTGWGNFMDDCGLRKIFKEELFATHPGICKLEERHLHLFKSVDSSQIEPYNVERLEWLIWWTEWALKNCKNPIIKNS